MDDELISVEAKGNFYAFLFFQPRLLHNLRRYSTLQNQPQCKSVSLSLNCTSLSVSHQVFSLSFQDDQNNDL